MSAQSVELLILAATIASIPTAAIAAFGFAMRRSGDLSSLLATREAQDKALARLETDLREERTKRDEIERVLYEMPGRIAIEYLQREDHIRSTSQIDRKLDVLSCRVDDLTGARSVPISTS